MTRIVIILTLSLLVAVAPAAWAFNCPVVIKQAEDLITLSARARRFGEP